MPTMFVWPANWYSCDQCNSQVAVKANQTKHKESFHDLPQDWLFGYCGVFIVETTDSVVVGETLDSALRSKAENHALP